MHYTVTSGDGATVKVEAANWMMAMGQALAFFDVEADAIGRWICTPESSGEIHIEDPISGHTWVVGPVADEVTVVAVGPEEEDDPPRPPETLTPMGPPPRLHMPPGSRLAPPQEPLFSPDELAEQLFDLSMELVGKPAEAACQAALKLIQDFVPTDAGSILRGGINDVDLTFVAATGSNAERLLGERIPFGEGVVGLCFDTRIPIQISDAQDDERHLARFDEAFGFETRGMLCVPIANSEGVHGVVQLLNPPRPFNETDVETVRTIATTLAGALASGE